MANQAKEPNLLVTYDPAHRGKAEDEVTALLASVEEKPHLEDGTEGTFFVTVKNAKETVKKLSEAFEEDPEQFHYTHRWVPVDKWASSEMKKMLAEMKEFDKQMDGEKSWKMELHKRGMEKSTVDMIKELTEAIDKKNVDLKNPETIVSIEIFGDRAALSLLDRKEWLNTMKR